MLSLDHKHLLISSEPMYYAGILFILPCTIILYMNFYPRKPKTLVPTDWPIVRHLPALLLNFNCLHQYITDGLAECGGTFMFRGPRLTNMDILLTSDPANIHYILAKNFPNFPKGPDYKKIFVILGDGIFNSEFESWENQRKITKSLINLTCFQEYVAKTSWEKVETALAPILELRAKTGKEVDMQDLFKRFAFDCSCIEVVGHDPCSLSHELPDFPYEKAFAEAEEALFYRHALPEFLWKLLKWLNIGTERQMTKAGEVVDRFLSYCISLRRQDLEGNPIRKDGFDILSCYMRAVEDKGEEVAEISEENWRDTMLNLIFAGKDTISAALTWFFWLLATNPEEEEKVRREILTNLEMNEGEWKFNNIEELKKLVYLHGALCEALRLFPAIPFQHKAPVEDDVLPSGHAICRNTMTLLSFYSVGRMETVWGKDCLEFKPGRWISEQGRIRVEPSAKFPAFNAGPRSCLGKETSFVQMKIVAAAIIPRFRIRVVEGHPVVPVYSIVLHMKHGFKARVSKVDTQEIMA